MATLQQSKQEVTMAVAQHHGCCTRGLVYAHVVGEILSHLVVLIVAWFTTAYVIAPYFLAHYVLALLASNLHWWELLQSPLLWLFPPGTGRLVAPSQGGRPKTFRALSWCLRLAVLGWLVWAVATVLHLEMGRIDCTKSHDCDGLPPWLRQPWWSQQPTCPVTGHSYTKCVEETPWYGRGCCNMSAGGCYRFALPDWLMGVAVVVPLIFGSFLALPASLLLSSALCCRAGALGQETVRVRRVNIGSEDESEGVTAFDRFMFFAFTLFPLVLDVFLDLNGILQYILTGNFQFAIVSTSIFAMSVIRRGILHKFGQAAIQSMHRARSTDDLEIIMLSGKITEAATQLMLQYYAFHFVTSSELAIWSFLFSMALSLKGVADAVYELIELDLYQITKKDVKKKNT